MMIFRSGWLVNEMTTYEYRIRGKIFVTRFCDCHHCDGHEIITVVVDDVVEADCGAIAEELLEGRLNEQHTRWEWYPENPEVEEIEADEEDEAEWMIRNGQRPLFGEVEHEEA